MKFILAALFLSVITTSAQAHSCKAFMENQRGRIVDTFYGDSNWSKRQACQDAREKCQHEVNRSGRNGHHLSCRVENDHRPPRNQSCSFDLVSHHGDTLQSFFGRSCHDVQEDCFRELRHRQRDGRNSSATCVKRRSSRRGQTVTRQCTVDRMTRRGTLVQVHTANATGRVSTGVQQRACSMAMRQCQNVVRGRQNCYRR